MSKEGSPSPPTDLAERLALLHEAETGRLEGLSCPRCGAHSVSVSFTRRAENDYWTWFTCNHCDFEMRAQGSRPAHYTPERERPERMATP
jgi:hypothetical protein